MWILRRHITGSTFGGGTADQPPARGALGLAAKAAIGGGYAEAVTGFRTAAIEREGDGRLVLVGEDGRRTEPVDEVIVLTGFRPDPSFLSEVRLGLDKRLQAPVALALVPGPTVLLVAFSVLAGMVRGNLTLLQAAAVTDRWGATHYGRPSGLLGAPVTVAGALAPWGAAALAGALGGYPPLFGLLAELSVISAVLAVGTGASARAAAARVPAETRPGPLTWREASDRRQKGCSGGSDA